MAGEASPGPLAPALHANEQLLAQLGGTVVQGTDRPPAASRDLLQRPGTHRSDRDLGPPPQRRPETLRVARRRPRNHRKGTPRTQNPVPSQIRDAALCRDDDGITFDGGGSCERYRLLDGHLVNATRAI